MKVLKTESVATPIRVAILDDHQIVLDGYYRRLSESPRILVAATAQYWDEFERLLSSTPVDVIVLDVWVRTSPESSEDYPILYAVPRLFERLPDVVIIIITQENRRYLAQELLDAGVSAYILKDDLDATLSLSKLIEAAVFDDQFHPYVSPSIEQALKQTGRLGPPLTPRQLETLSLAAANPSHTERQLAGSLGISHGAVRMHLWNTYQRLGVNNLAAAIAKARDMGLITPARPNRQ